MSVETLSQRRARQALAPRSVRADVQTAVAGGSASGDGRVSILLVDDQPDNLRALAAVLGFVGRIVPHDDMTTVIIKA